MTKSQRIRYSILAVLVPFLVVVALTTWFSVSDNIGTALLWVTMTVALVWIWWPRRSQQH